MLGILVTLLLTPAFAQWVYYEFDTAPSVQKQYPIQMEEFQYEQTVTLPGAPGTTTPEETTPDPEGPEETTPDPEDTEEPEQTTPQPETPSVPEGENHYNMVNMVFADLDGFLALGLDEEFYNDISINGEGMLHDAIFGKMPTLYSVAANFSGGKLSDILRAANADKLGFVLVYNKSKNEIIMYSFEDPNANNVSTGTRIVVYQSFAYKNSTTEKWEIDQTKTTIGTAQVKKAPNGGKNTINEDSYQVTTKANGN